MSVQLIISLTALAALVLLVTILTLDNICVWYVWTLKNWLVKKLQRKPNETFSSVSFEQSNVVLGEGQDEYFNLHGCAIGDEKGQVVFRWCLTMRERILVLLTGRIWHLVLTFNKPLQPQCLTVDHPFDEDDKENKKEH